MIRIGFGYDSHRFAGDGPLTLGGVRIEHEKGFAAHSDGDVVLHALTDAILGGLAAGDIGEHFPDTDPQYKNADSAVFLRHANKLAADAGYSVGNCDITILAESPKLGPHKAAIAANIAEILNIEPGCVSVKAKTNETMGFIGRAEGIAVMANVLLRDM
ncbi:MAG: 2-C-methyl-D-erythritol 2,4-cyclodiphosphate synthase [Phycisphaerae bacterium]|nr:2-C-methyl-D-erythritol 2,4-cyclodiphosphate synthase [Phycisphaerae bacterium]